jgi:hypothetical protein
MCEAECAAMPRKRDKRERHKQYTSKSVDVWLSPEALAMEDRGFDAEQPERFRPRLVRRFRLMAERLRRLDAGKPVSAIGRCRAEPLARLLTGQEQPDFAEAAKQAEYTANHLVGLSRPAWRDRLHNWLEMPRASRRGGARIS